MALYSSAWQTTCFPKASSWVHSLHNNQITTDCTLKHDIRATRHIMKWNSISWAKNEKIWLLIGMKIEITRKIITIPNELQNNRKWFISIQSIILTDRFWCEILKKNDLTGNQNVSRVSIIFFAVICYFVRNWKLSEINGNKINCYSMLSLAGEECILPHTLTKWFLTAVLGITL